MPTFYHLLHSMPHFFVTSLALWMWELVLKEGVMPKNWCFQIVVLEKTLESPLDSKEIKPVNPKGNKPWIFLGRTDAEAPILGYLIGRADSLEKTLMLEKVEGRRRSGEKEEMVGSHHWLNGHYFEQILEDSKRQEAWCVEVPIMITGFSRLAII